MCGIAGYWGNVGDQEDLLARMQEMLLHRGPDGTARFLEDGIALGLTRLSINDAEGGTRIFTDESGRVAVVANGEIYNAPELRRELEGRGHRFETRCDIEVVPHLYEDHGPDAIARLEGMFALVIWDARARRLILSRDRFGIKPIFYFHGRAFWAFASEIKSLFRHPEVPKRPNWQAISDYLTLGYIPGEQTAFEGILKLPPGSYLEVRDDSSRLVRYWDLRFEGTPVAGDPAEIAEESWRRLRSAVRRQLLSDYPVGALLSGGLDSGAIVAAMSELGVSPLHTFSVGCDDTDFDERAEAAVVARRFGAEHHVLRFTPEDIRENFERYLWQVDEPMGDPSAIPLLCICQLARQFVKVVLSGEGGDELFAGYETHRVANWVASYRRLPSSLRRGVIEPLVRCLPPSDRRLSFEFKAKRFISGASLPLVHGHLHWRQVFGEAEKRALLRIGDDISLRPTIEVFERVSQATRADSDINRLLYLDSRLYLCDDLLVKADRMSMACGLETRVPMTDTDLVEYVAHVPPRLKKSAFQTKPLLRRALRGRLPRRIVNKAKVGFTIPLARWLRGPSRDVVLELTSPETLRGCEFLDRGAVERLVTAYFEGAYNEWWPLWVLLNLIGWHRMHF